MESESDRTRQFSRRALILGAGQAALVTALVGRMYYLSVVQGKQYSVLAEENRLSLRLVPPLRGRILDRFGEEIATNKQDLRVVVIPEHVKDLTATLDALAELIPLEISDRERIYSQVKKQRSFVPVTVTENLDWENFAKVNVATPRLPGVQPAAGASRYYPDAVSAAHVIGHVGTVSEDDDDGDPVLQLPGFKIGKMGIERSFDKSLRGVAGTSRVEVNAVGRVIREIARQEAKPGSDLKLTLSMPLQRKVAERMGEESASAVVLDIVNGDILALVSMPAFDPNAFSVGIARDYWQALRSDPRTPMVNKCLSGLYPPGSTFKMVSALAALKENVVDFEESFYCNGRFRLGNQLFHCWKEHGHGQVNFKRALVESCDVFYYNIARRIGVDAMAEMAHQLGLGQRYDLPLIGEKAGLIPTQAWKRATRGAPWVGGETLNTAIGQGFLLTTPMQLAVMTARLASGRAVMPRISDQDPVPIFEPLPIPRQNLISIREALDDAVNVQGGTAFTSRIRTQGRSMAGKTGTSQVRRISLAERSTGVLKNEERPWIERDHALFVGYAPVVDPRYAVAVVVEHGGGGATAAAPLARDILDWAQEMGPSIAAATNAVRES